jgi:inosine-uridine nucleoside N-ribohydrolase
MRATKRLPLLLGAALTTSGQILFDTDSGTFADDGVALVMLMRSARAPAVKAVTVVSGNVWARPGAEFMRRNLRLLGFPNVPVHVGAQNPLVHTVEMSKRERGIRFSGAFAQPRETAAVSTAIEAMAAVIDAAPGQVTILAIGPLTNVATLLRLRPDVESRIAALVFMGGNVRVGGNASKSAEFNFWFDPEAAQVVMRSAIPKKVMFGLDVCNNVKLTRAVFDEVVAVNTPITELYRDDFGNGYPGFLKKPDASGYLWDELAAASLIEPSIVTRTESMHLDVETAFGSKYGAAKPLDRRLAPGATPVEVVLEVNQRRVFEIYKRALMAR